MNSVTRAVPPLTGRSTGPWQPWAMLGVLLLAQLALSYAGRAVAPLAPFLEGEFSLSKTQVGMLQSAFFIGQTLGALPSGMLTDRIGVRPMLALCPAVVGAGLLVLAATYSWSWTLAMLVITGAAYVAMHVVTTKGLIDWFPPHNRGTAVGIKQTGITTGGALSAAAVPALALALGWRWAVVANVALLAVVAVITVRLWRRPPAVIATGASLPVRPQGGELRRLIRNGPLWRLSLMVIPLLAAQFSTNTYLMLYLRDDFGFTVVIAGALLGVAELAGSGGRIFWGILSDRLWGARRQPALQAVAATGALAATAAALLPATAPTALMVAMVILLGLSTAGFNGLWLTLAAESVEPRLAGMASGLSLSVAALGAIIGPPLFGLAVDLSGSYRTAWWLTAALLAANWLAFKFTRLEEAKR